MGKIFKFIKTYRERHGTRVSPLAILCDTEYHDTSAILPLVKMERAKIGKYSYMGTMSAAYDCEIGNFCCIARECYIGGPSHPLDWVSSSSCFFQKENPMGTCFCENEYNWHISRVNIGNDVWIGYGAIILGGVSVANGAVIGAGSVVTKDVGAYEIWAGNPAKFIKKRFDDETIRILQQSQWWDWSKDKLYEAGRLFPDINQFIEYVKYTM